MLIDCVELGLKIGMASIQNPATCCGHSWLQPGDRGKSIGDSHPQHVRVCVTLPSQQHPEYTCSF